MKGEERKDKAALITALRLLGVKRSVVEELFANNKNTITTLVEGFMRRRVFGNNKVTIPNMLKNRIKNQQCNNLTANAGQYLKERTHVHLEVEQNLKVDDLSKDLKKLSLKGQGGIIWIERIEDTYVKASALNKWTLFKLFHFEGGAIPVPPVMEHNKYPENKMKTKYLSFVMALTIQGESAENIKKILTASAYSLNMSDVEALLSMGKDIKRENRDRGKKSYILHNVKQRNDLERVINELIEQKTQGFIYIEKFILKDRLARSKWLVIQNT